MSKTAMAADNRDRYALVADPAQLREAWEQFLHEPTTRSCRFRCSASPPRADASFDELARVLARRTYSPAPLRPVALPKSDGGERLRTR
jgi:hypothetical protein